ncbi:MAG: hypothetical protein V2A76_07010 [Planctomycetota bacterium]
MRSVPVAVVLLLILAASPGCQLLRHIPFLSGEPLPPPRAFKDVTLDHGLVHRVLALPLADESGFGTQSDVVSESLRDEIGRLGQFSVVRPSASDAMLKPGDGPHNTGRIPVATIIELGRRYGVDAVLFGAIFHYRPYSPPALGMEVSLVDVQTGRVLWTVRDSVDGSDKRCAVSMEWFFEDEIETDETVFGSDLMHVSPHWFARFAAHRIAQTLLPPQVK